VSAARPVLISNPTSFTNEQRGQAKLESLVLEAGGLVLNAADEAGLSTAVTRALAGPVTFLAINGGDGTVHGVVHRLAAAGRQAEVPLLVLSGGRTNVIAADLGTGGRRAARLASRLAAWRHGQGRETLRPCLQLNLGNGETCHGFLLNAAGLAAAIEDCWAFRQRYRRFGMHGGTGTGTWVAKKLLAASLGRPVLRSCAASLIWDGRQVADRLFVLSATTHRRLPLGVQPYWGAAEGDLKVTAIGGLACGFQRRLPALLLGRGGRYRDDPGYLSDPATELQLIAGEELVFHLDGESHRLPAGGEMTINRGPDIRFVA